jgi:uncharacterized protein YndB with AHSA1/START domain
MVRASIDLQGIGPSEAIRAFTEPSLLKEWWGGELEIEPKPGGAYIVHFESQGWTLRGQVVSYDPESQLTFTWAWEHQPDDPTREVEVRAQPVGDGTRLEIEHGPHGDSEHEQEEAVGHREGWEHFLPRLAESVKG